MAGKADLGTHPITRMEAMLNGSLISLGDFFDPKKDGSKTHLVLKSTGAAYQEALNKCEIQILNAKWILEHDLARARAKRAAKTIEITNPAKRKFESSDDSQAATLFDETPTKKQKTDSSEETLIADESKLLEEPEAKAKVTQDSQAGNTEIEGDDQSKEVNHLDSLDQMLNEMAQDSKDESDPSNQGATEQDPPPNEPTSQAAPEQDPLPPSDPMDTTNQDPPQTATSANAIDFESMFGDLGSGGGGDASGEINFDDLDNLNSTDNFDMAISDAQNMAQRTDSTGGGGIDPSLNSLLPGLESYANDPSSADGSGLPNSSTATNNIPVGTSTNVFDLPEMGDGNTFDDLFGDSLGGGDGTGERKDEDMLNDDAILDMGQFDDWLMD